MAGCAADCGEDLLAGPNLVVDVAPSGRGQEAHEAREVVDSAPASPWIAKVFGVREGIAQTHLLGRDAERAFLREQVVGDPHLVAIRVSAKRNQRGMLRLPPEPSDAAFAGFDVDDEPGAAADAVTVTILRILERHRV